MIAMLKNLRKFDGGAVFLSCLALVLEKLGSKNIALNILNKAINNKACNRDLHLHASRLYLKKGQVDRAVTHWKMAAGPENIGSFIYWLNKTKKICSIATNNQRKGTTNYESPSSQMSSNDDVGFGLLERGYLEEALRTFLADLKKDKSNPLLLFNIGFLYSKLNKNVEALNFYEKAQSSGLNNLELLNNKGYSLFCLGRYDAAQTCYELARGLASTDYIILNNLAACYLKTNQLNKAKSCFLSAVENYPGDATLENNLAICMESSGNFEQAIKHYDKAILYEKNQHARVKIVINKISCLLKRNKLDEALELCNQIQPCGDYHYEIWGIRANILNELGRTSEAAESYRKALGLTI